ncbi:helix-turn-helix domain-containing protein [Winogradskyella immobilis]|uniref:Helix-turn-helix transcriptional regulator n=1 Tax=Winogradskyella immobilis TaxID=2816852 RepID=A0ABS8ET84_9FLAO|nr:helix-turn-helix transcriptional regulator [Winogradskyella immobilis]MCC1485487.1 helix-turn-helix transcriptional regulator [Winogradskyella immobilis]MCG0017579.1 helix-turn-helix transcriptional regulator [Winogradskyella immobilis]
MCLLEDFNNDSDHNVLKGTHVTCVEYIHPLDAIDIEVSFNEVLYLYIKTGEANLESYKGACNIKAGTSTIIKNGKYILSKSPSIGYKSFKAYLFFLSKEALKQFHYKNPLKEDQLSNEINNVIHIDNCAFLDQLNSSISLLFNKTYIPKIKQTLIDLKSIELLHYLSINPLSSTINNALYSALEDDNYNFKTAINNNILNNLSISEYASLCHMSLSNFKRRFQTVYGISPAKWIKNRKLEHSLYLLESGQYKINEIAYKCGFNNSKTFRRLFKDKYKMLPSAFYKTAESESFLISNYTL